MELVNMKLNYSSSVLRDLYCRFQILMYIEDVIFSQIILFCFVAYYSDRYVSSLMPLIRSQMNIST